MTLKQLQFFKKAAELENITMAAKELFIAQPALSKSIKDLENELGYSLFERNGKKLTLNQNGEILYKHVLHIQNNFNHMENELREANSNKSATIHILVRVASKLLPDILNTYYQKHPDAKLKIFQTNQLIKGQPEYDLIMDSKPMIAPLVSNKEMLLLEERILVALPKSHPLTEQKKIALSDLKGFACSILSETSSLGRMVRSELSAQHFTPNIIFESDNPHTIRDFLKLNLSYSFVPEKTWLLKNDFPQLVLREVEDFCLYRYIYITYGQQEYITNATKDFVNHVKAYFKDLT